MSRELSGALDRLEATLEAGVPGLPPVRGRASRWTPARVALLEAEYAGAPALDLLAARLNELPGKRVTVKALMDKANWLGLRRSDRRAPVRPSVSPKPPQPFAPEDFAPEIADTATVVAWASANGMASADGLAAERVTLAAVNARRLELGLPPFSLRRRSH